MMSSQKSLTAFFKPVSKKRSSTEAEEATGEAIQSEKRRKIELKQEDLSSEPILSSKQIKETNDDAKTSLSSDVSAASPNRSSESTDRSGAVKTENNPNVMNTPPHQSQEKKMVSSPFGMLTPLQCLAKIKSQCSKTPALHHSIGPSWYFALHAEFQKTYFQKLSDFIVKERANSTVYPSADQVWTWTTKVPIKDVKVVILGQDPYHNPGQAHGLSFSVPKGVTPPPSLMNIFKELSNDIPGFTSPNHGYLDGWAQQGVLLLNACLTVRANNPNSHKDQGWEQLTDAVIKYLSANGRNIVFLLWGSYAQKKGAVVDKKKHHILKTVHPSPLSAHRGFFGCMHFSQCNELLNKAGKKPIDWAYLP